MPHLTIHEKLNSASQRAHAAVRHGSNVVFYNIIKPENIQKLAAASVVSFSRRRTKKKKKAGTTFFAPKQNYTSISMSANMTPVVRSANKHIIELAMCASRPVKQSYVSKTLPSIAAATLLNLFFSFMHPRFQKTR